MLPKSRAHYHAYTDNPFGSITIKKNPVLINCLIKIRLIILSPHLHSHLPNCVLPAYNLLFIYNLSIRATRSAQPNLLDLVSVRRKFKFWSSSLHITSHPLSPYIFLATFPWNTLNLCFPSAWEANGRFVFLSLRNCII